MDSLLLLFITLFVFVSVCSGTKQMHPSAQNAFGLVEHDVAYHLLCDQGTKTPLNPPAPRACFETRWHIAGNLRNPHPVSLNGFIDASGKRKFSSWSQSWKRSQGAHGIFLFSALMGWCAGFMLRPDAVVTLRNLEIHVKHSKDKASKVKDQSCVDVTVYRLPKREIQVRENWCPGQFRPILL